MSSDLVELRELLLRAAFRIGHLPVEMHPPCVYFLLGETLEDVIYVGQTSDLFTRVGRHSKTKRFDWVLFIPVERCRLLDVEMAMIRMFRPWYNNNKEGTGYQGREPTEDQAATCFEFLSRAPMENLFAALGDN